MFLPAKKSLGIMASEQLICHMKKFLILREKFMLWLFFPINIPDENAGCYEMFLTTFITSISLTAKNFFSSFLG